MSARRGVADSDHEVIVLGGGPAGAAAALALAQRGVRVALLDKRRATALRIGETVPPMIMRPLARLGLWDAFVAARHGVSPGTVVIWGEDRPYENDFILNPYGCGWHLDRERFDGMLIAAAQTAGAGLYQNVASAESRGNEHGGWTVVAETETGRVILGARWLVDATGRSAWLARRQGIRRRAIDRMVALVRFGPRSSGDDRTFIEARPTGWWYAARLPDGGAIAAFFTDADLLPHGKSSWKDLIADTRLVAGMMAPSRNLSGVYIIPASSGRLETCVGRDWLAIGDAAQCYDACSGQGIAKALDSAIAAAEAISAQKAGHNSSFYSLADQADAGFQRYLVMHLAHYRRERRWPESPFWARRAG
jgi:flavin-dependent dehydrogenase